MPTIAMIIDKLCTYVATESPAFQGGIRRALVEKSWQESAALPEQAARPGGGGGGQLPPVLGGKSSRCQAAGSRTVLSYCTPLIMCLLQFLYNYEDRRRSDKVIDKLLVNQCK
jgi:hypothetical protein